MKGAAQRGGVATPQVWRPSELASYDGPLLLDTHVWIWYLEGDASQWAPETGVLLDRVGSATRLLVSDISSWEVAVKAGKGKLTLSIDVAVWLQRAEQAPGIRFLPLDRQLLLLSTRLPGAAHADPADRMLLAATLLHHVPLVTADRTIIDYARVTPGVPVVDVRRARAWSSRTNRSLPRARHAPPRSPPAPATA